MQRAPAAKPHIAEEGYSYEQLLPMVRATLDRKLSVLLRGHPGVGKSSMAQELARAMQLPLVDIRLAQREPAELAGVYFPDSQRKHLQLLAPDWVRQVCAEPCLVFLDEINAAVTRLHQAAAYQIVLEKRVGPFVFHPGTVVLAAGNLDDDAAIAVPLSSALNNRFVHFRLKVDAAAWLQWAQTANIHPAIVAWLDSQGAAAAGHLYDNTGDDAFATPRSWAMASELLHTTDDDALGKRLVAACVGQTGAEKLFNYLKIWRKIDAAAIIVKGKPLGLPQHSYEPSLEYAAAYAVADWLLVQAVVPDAWLGNIVAFLHGSGLQPELQWLVLRKLKGSGIIERMKPLPAFRAQAANLVRLRTAVLA